MTMRSIIFSALKMTTINIEKALKNLGVGVGGYFSTY
jgi:hypothetical protein